MQRKDETKSGPKLDFQIRRRTLPPKSVPPAELPAQDAASPAFHPASTANVCRSLKSKVSVSFSINKNNANIWASTSTAERGHSRSCWLCLTWKAQWFQNKVSRSSHVHIVVTSWLTSNRVSRGQGGCYVWFAFPPKTLPALNTDELEAPEEPVTAKGDAATGTAFDPPAQ